MATFAGILAQVAEKGDARRRRTFQPQDVMDIANRTAKQFQRENMNLLSCYELNDDYGLHQTLGRFCKTNNPAGSKIDTALEDGDEQGLFAALLFAMRSAFVTLYQRNALKRIQLVEKWPEEAQKEYSWLVAVVNATTVSTPAPAAPIAPAAPVETPTEVCAREFKELSGDKFKVKWLNHQGNRAIYEQACEEGKI